MTNEDSKVAAGDARTIVAHYKVSNPSGELIPVESIEVEGTAKQHHLGTPNGYFEVYSRVFVTVSGHRHELRTDTLLEGVTQSAH